MAAGRGTGLKRAIRFLCTATLTVTLGVSPAKKKLAIIHRLHAQACQAR